MRTLSLLPRVRVNYTFSDLIKAMLVGHNIKYCEQCKDMISAFYRGESVLLVPSSRDAIYELLI